MKCMCVQRLGIIGKQQRNCVQETHLLTWYTQWPHNGHTRESSEVNRVNNPSSLLFPSNWKPVIPAPFCPPPCSHVCTHNLLSKRFPFFTLPTDRRRNVQCSQKNLPITILLPLLAIICWHLGHHLLKLTTDRVPTDHNPRNKGIIC